MERNAKQFNSFALCLRACIPVIAAAWVFTAGRAAAQGISQTVDGLHVQSEAQQLTAPCGGKSALVEGNHNTLTLSGVCASLVLKGVGNSVRLGIAPAGPIHVEGSANHIQFSTPGSPPAISVLGPDNAVTAASDPAAADPAPSPQAAQVNSPTPSSPTKPPVALVPQAPQTAGSEPLTLSGDDQQRLADCAAREVTITGRRSAYVLRGGCRSVTIKGNLLTVQAELLPAAHVTIVGDGDVVSWAVRGRGHAPLATVHGQGSRVQRADQIGGQPVH